MNSVGKIVRELRTERGYTQEDIAAALGVDRETISRIERSATAPKRGNTLRRVFEFFKLDDVEIQRAMRGEPLHTKEEVDSLLAVVNELAAKRKGNIPPEILGKVRSIEKNGASADYLASIGATPAPTAGTRVRPIHGGDEIAAGKPIRASADFDFDQGNQFLPGELFPWDNMAFFVRVAGNSMYPDFEAGDILIGSPALRDQVETNDCVCVRFTKESRFGGGLAVKRIRAVDDAKLYLASRNPSEPDIGEVLFSEIDAMGPCVVHIRQLWKTAGFATEEIAKASRIAGTARKVNAEDVPQKFPDYDGPQPDPDKDQPPTARGRPKPR